MVQHTPPKNILPTLLPIEKVQNRYRQAMAELSEEEQALVEAGDNGWGQYIPRLCPVLQLHRELVRRQALPAITDDSLPPTVS